MRAKVFNAWHSIAQHSMQTYMQQRSYDCQSCPQSLLPLSPVTAASDAQLLQTTASDAQTLLQKALQTWHALILHMADRRQTMHQAALASADQAVRTGCQAAAIEVLSWNRPSAGKAGKPGCPDASATSLSQAQHTASDGSCQAAAELLNWSQHPAGKAVTTAAADLICLNQHRANVAPESSQSIAAAELPSWSQRTAGTPIKASRPVAAAQSLCTHQYQAGKAAMLSSQSEIALIGDSKAYAQPLLYEAGHSPSPSAVMWPPHAQFPRDAPTAIAWQHCRLTRLKQAFRQWLQETQLSVAMLYQQHELKAAVNGELLQVCVCFCRIFGAVLLLLWLCA